LPGADKQAEALVARLAPEADVMPHWGLGFEVRGQQITWRGVNNACCYFTFHSDRDNGVPLLERALNNYLWLKLWPKRFKRRAPHTKWGG